MEHSYSSLENPGMRSGSVHVLLRNVLKVVEMNERTLGV